MLKWKAAGLCRMSAVSYAVCPKEKDDWLREKRRQYTCRLFTHIALPACIFWFYSILFIGMIWWFDVFLGDKLLCSFFLEQLRPESRFHQSEEYSRPSAKKYFPTQVHVETIIASTSSWKCLGLISEIYPNVFFEYESLPSQGHPSQR